MLERLEERMNNDYEQLDARVERVGPFNESYYKITIGGYLVPYIKAYKNIDGSWTLLLDGRFAIDIQNEEEIQRWVWWVANAMAIASGYSCFGANSAPIDLFNRQLIGLSQNETDGGD
jgi:hypothetical protein